MNRPDEPFERLLHAAGKPASSPVRLTPPYGLETRVLAAWRSTRGSAMVWDSGVLVRGLAVAAFLVVVSSWPALEQQTNSDSENLQVADSSVQTDNLP